MFVVFMTKTLESIYVMTTIKFTNERCLEDMAAMRAHAAGVTGQDIV